MQILNLATNDLVGLPTDIWKMKSLHLLNLSDNMLESLPESIGKLPALKVS